MFLKYREVLDIFIKRLPVSEDNDEVFHANAELYFRACIELLRSDGDEELFGAGIAVRLLNKVELGYGCWLEDIRIAINAAKEDFPSHYGSFYERFKGAAVMAEVYLLNLGWMEQKCGKQMFRFLTEHFPDEAAT
jgi:hypothetical protein